MQSTLQTACSEHLKNTITTGKLFIHEIKAIGKAVPIKDASLALCINMYDIMHIVMFGPAFHISLNLNVDAYAREIKDPESGMNIDYIFF